MDTKVTDEEELEETCFFITSHLNETKKPARTQIRKIVQVIGTDKALQFLKQAREVERAGGMLTMNGKKRRTIGGVFFYLVRTQTDEVTVTRIWPDRNKP